MTYPETNKNGRNFDVPRYRQHYQQMLRIRAFEQAALRALEEGLVHGAIHPSIGQEAIASGVCSNLRPDDILLSTHRGHGHTLVKGADPIAMMCELFGKQNGCCGGKGGSMHIADFQVGMLGANGVVAANIAIAAGAAHAIKLKQQDNIVTCIFGDGAVNRGPFLEGLNWAKVYQLPVLFICEDNTFAATTRSASMTAGEGPAARAESLGLPATIIDGNDIVTVNETADTLIKQIRSDSKPRFLLAKTYRLTGHTGADPALYRSKKEVEERWQHDPIARCQQLLLDSGVTQAELDKLKFNAEQELQSAFEIAKHAPWPDPEQAYSDVLDTVDPSARAY